jgi:hypothetical protein
MKKLILIIGVAIGLSSCEGDGIENTKTNNDEYDVTYLFEKDGVKVYRFVDGMRSHYFTTGGQTMSTQTEGKNNYEETINSKY